MEDEHAVFKAELLAALSDKVKIDWEQFDNRNLLTCYAISACWSWDATIRVYGVADHIQVTDNPESWAGVIQDANRRRDKITLNDLAKLYLDGVEFPAVLILCYVKILFDRGRREILRRIELRPVGRQIVFWIDRFPKFKQQDLLSAFQPPETITLRGKRIKLSDPFRNSPSDRKEWERKSLNVATALEFYESLKSGSNQTPVNVPLLPIRNTYPEKLELWAKVFPKLIQEQRDAHVAELLSILDGEMEKTPLQVFNAYRNAFREELSWSAQKGEAEAATDEEREYISQIHYEALEREVSRPEYENLFHINKAKKIFSERLEAKLSKAHVSTRPKIRKGIELILKDYSLKDSAHESEMDEKTLRLYIRELGLSPVRAVHAKRKP